jgi:hypothetical protein
MLREGARPEEIAVDVSLLEESVKAIAMDTLAEVAPGPVAIISANPEIYTEWLDQGGWQRNGTLGGRRKDGYTLVCLSPAQARGLEFDGVVVAEPSQFIVENAPGVLYTVLTRSTKVLKVVSSIPWH